MSGYSRAAATSNRLGALLQDERLVRPEDLYVYTFATPNVTKQEDAPSYQSIYNIVGAFDPVPMVPFADWGFTRYGQTFVRPAPQINRDYVKRVAPVALLHLRYTGTPYWSNLSGISAVGKLLSSLSESVRDTQEYTEKLQPLLMDLWAKRNSRLGMLTTFISHFTLKEESLSGVLRNFFSIISNSLGESMLQGEGAFAPQWQEDKSLRDNLAREHFPEGYMAWVSAYSTLEEMRTPTLVYRQLALDGFDKVEVRDEEGNIVASLGFEEGEIVHGPEGSLTFTQVGNELELNLPADQDMRVSLRAMGGVLAFLRVKEGQAGYTRMQVYETGDLTPREGETFQLTLPRLTGQAEAGASVYQLAGTQRGFALTHQPNAQALSAQEMNSTFTSMFTQNLATGIAVMLLVFILLLFTILLSVRGLRRSMYKRRLRKCGTPLARAPLRGNFLNRKQPFKIPVKLFGLLVFGTGLAIAVAAVRVGLSWVREIQFIQQRTMFLFSLMYYVPFLVLLVCCAFPAIYAGGYALLWLSDLYMLRTSRLHARIGFLFSLGLGAVMTLPSYGYFSRILLYAVPLQILFLVLLLSMLRRAIKRNRKLDQAAEKTENSHNNEAENQAIVLDK